MTFLGEKYAAGFGRLAKPGVEGCELFEGLRLVAADARGEPGKALPCGQLRFEYLVAEPVGAQMVGPAVRVIVEDPQAGVIEEEFSADRFGWLEGEFSGLQGAGIYGDTSGAVEVHPCHTQVMADLGAGELHGSGGDHVVAEHVESFGPRQGERVTGAVVDVDAQQEQSAGHASGRHRYPSCCVHPRQDKLIADFHPVSN